MGGRKGEGDLLKYVTQKGNIGGVFWDWWDCFVHERREKGLYFPLKDACYGLESKT